MGTRLCLSQEEPVKWVDENFLRLISCKLLPLLHLPVKMPSPSSPGRGSPCFSVCELWHVVVFFRTSSPGQACPSGLRDKCGQIM